MASLQAHVSVWLIKWRVKRQLKGLQDYIRGRKILRPLPVRIPPDIRITPAQLGGVPGEWVESAKRSGRSLIYFHGGGYFACSAKGHRPVTIAYAQQGFRVFAPDYRLAPEHPFPAAVEDAVSVYAALLSQGGREIVISGDSAGGGLSLALVHALRQRQFELPAAVAVFSPWTDLTNGSESMRNNERRCAMFNEGNFDYAAEWYLAGADPRDPLASPLYGDLRGFPPVMLHVGKNEMLRDDSVRFAERARAAGVDVHLKIWPIVPHCWQLAHTAMPEAVQSVREAAVFLQRVPVHAPVATVQSK
jgi:monoterpene epsilon-lactone hydrolase